MVKIFGILNVTPDSFSDGGQFNSTEKALAQARKLFADGADFVDVGGESTRPGARELWAWEEWGRLEKFFSKIKKYELGNEKSDFTLHISSFSLDTRKPYVAKKFLKLGGRIINDVSGFQSPKMIKLAAAYDATCIVNHFPGKTIAEVHEQKISSIKQIKEELLQKKSELVVAGVDPDKIILDPGIGFGKTMTLNEALLKFPEIMPDEKIMIGHSKKRFLGDKRKEKTPNVAAAKVAIESGAWALRVHDPIWYK